MVIPNRVEDVLRLLNRVKDYNRLIIANTFEENTIDDMKGNAKDLCNQAKGKIDQIKTEIDDWS